MREKILCVDDESNILLSYQRQMRTLFDVEVALSGREGLEIIASHGHFAVVVSDLRMPEMDGIEFLSRVREIAQDSVRIMITGNADLQAAVQAVNEGNIFRFLTKPCPTETLIKSLNAGIAQYQLVIAERELLEKTLRGSVKILTDVLSLISPAAFGKATRVRRIVTRIISHLQVDCSWKYEIAAMLSQVGCVTVPAEILDKRYRGNALSAHEIQLFHAHPQVGHDLIANIPRLEEVAEIIAYQGKHFDGSGLPDDDKRGDAIPLGARILHVALDFDALVSSEKDARHALERIQNRPARYDPQVMAALFAAVESEIANEVQTVKLSELAPGMIFAHDVTAVSGVLLVAQGQEVTQSLKMRLENFKGTMKVAEPLQVFVPLQSTN